MEAVAAERDLVSESAAEFERLRRRREPEWLGRRREDAFARFAELGPPAPTLESWRFTNASRIARTPFEPAAPLAGLRALRPESLPRIPDAIELVFVNGFLSSDLAPPDLPEGLLVRGLATALASDPSLVEPYLGRVAPDPGQAFAALNEALFSDGALVSIGPGAVVERPIHLVFLSAGGERPAAAHVRNLIVAAPGSQATVVETWASGAAGAAPVWSNAVTEIVCGDGAVLEHYRVEREAAKNFLVQAIHAEQHRASRFVSHNLTVGGALVRTDLVARLAEGADCVLNGLFYGNGSRHVDNHTTIDHAEPHGTSRELYKGILDGKSRGIFHGKIIVRPDAQKTDAMQTNKNLLLSRDALVNSTPALEIHADDVKCRHGSTIGQLDPEALFYLRSRGIGEAEARALLLYAFAADLAGRMRVPAVREWLEGFLGLHLAPGAEAA